MIRPAGLYRTSAAACLLALAVVAPVQAETAVFCPLRRAKTAQAWAIARVRAEATTESSASGRGDHCDEQDVRGRVVATLKGPLKPGDPVRFTLTQGACGGIDPFNDDFIDPGGEVVVVLQRGGDGALFAVRSETPADHEARERACR